MRTVLLITILFFVIRSIAQSPGVERMKQVAAREKQKYSAVYNTNLQSQASGNFVVNYYRCEWNIDPAVRYISGSVTSYFKITSATGNIVYDFTNVLTVDSIIFRKKKISFSQQENKTLTIYFPSTLSLNRKDSVSVFYHGIPPDGGAFTQTTHGKDVPVLWTLSEPFGAMDWWPCRNGLDDKADSIDIYITHPSIYKASSNGILVKRITNGDLTTSHYRHRYPIASYLVAIAVTNYKVDSRTLSINGSAIPLIQYVYPEDLTTFQDNTFILSNALELYSRNFGLYPFAEERYGQTEFGWGGGMEHQTNSFVTTATQNLMTHELGHQWFGDKVTCESWHDIWLNEGFATYLADMFYTEKIDTAYYKPYVEGDLAYIVSEKGGSVWVPDTTNTTRIFDSRLTYAKGAFLLRMLRWTLGDSAFFRGINQYLTDPKLAYGFARTADLQRNLETVSGKNLDYFFDQWFYGEGYPSFTVNWHQDSINHDLQFVVSETTSVPSSVSFFKVSLPVQLSNGMKQKTVVLKCNYNNQQFSVNDPGFKVKLVLIDPDHYLISKKNRAIKTAALQSVYGNVITAETSTSAGKISVRPNPVTSTAAVSLKDISGKTRLQLFNSAGLLLWQYIADIKNSSFEVTVPFTLYPAGSYRIVVTEENGTKNSVMLIK